MTAHLVPLLACLELDEVDLHDDRSADVLRALLAAVHSSSTLQSLYINMRSTDFHGHALDALAEGLAASSGVRELALYSLTTEQGARFAVAGLPPALEGLHGRCCNDQSLLLRAASHAAHLARFRWVMSGVNSSEQTEPLRALLASTTQLRELSLSYGQSKVGWLEEPKMLEHSAVLGPAVCACSPLRFLRLGCKMFLAHMVLAVAAAALRGNGTLHELFVGFDCSGSYGRERPLVARHAVEVAARLPELAAPLRTATALRVMRIVVMSRGPRNLNETLQSLCDQARAALSVAPRAASGALLVDVVLSRAEHASFFS